MAQSDNVVLIWLYRGRIETETTVWYQGTVRAKQLQAIMATTVYRVSPILKELQSYNGINWAGAKKVPDQIKLAAMLL